MNFIAMLCDDTQGVSRDFCIWANAASVLYPASSILNKIYGNGMPSTLLITVGCVFLYLFWFIFAYFGATDVLGSHTIGVANYVQVLVAAIFSVDMLFKSWWMVFNTELYLKYVDDFKNKPAAVSTTPERTA